MKNEYRRYFINLRKNIPQDTKTMWDKMIFEKLIATSFYKNAASIFIYLSTKDEVSTKKIIKKALEDRKRVYVPKIIEKNIMKACLINNQNDLIDGKFSIKTSKLNDFLENPDLSLVPGLSFDLKKNRLGYGGGYYDYFLANNKSTYIGLFYSCQKANKLDTNSFDKKLTYILTEKDLF